MRRVPALWWALLFGNFAIGCGVMVVAGTLTDLTRSLQVSVPVGGQLIAASAAVMCFGAPLVAVFVGGRDRRALLVASLLAYAAGHGLSALMPDFASLLAVRVLAVVGAAAFTPQAAAAISAMTEPAQRGRAITFIFLGWSVASVLGMPLTSLIGETLGWRWAFGFVAAVSLAAALAVARTMPSGVRPPGLSPALWRRTLTHPALMAIVLVTALNASGQFTLFAYFAPTIRFHLGGSAAAVSALFLWFGAFGLLGNVMLTRVIDRVGAARCVAVSLAAMAASFALWPLAHGPWVAAWVIVPWALGCFASNSAQQARLGGAAPALAPALMALNTSAMYLGQTVGAAGGGAVLAAGGYAPLAPVGLGWLLAAMAVSAWATARLARTPVPA